MSTDILALLDSLPYDELDLETSRFRLTLRRTPHGWTQAPVLSTRILLRPRPASGKRHGDGAGGRRGSDWLTARGAGGAAEASGEVAEEANGAADGAGEEAGLTGKTGLTAEDRADG